MSQGCNQCRNYVPGESSRSCIISKKHKLYATCLLDNNLLMQQWWNSHNDKTETLNTTCFEEREIFTNDSDLIKQLNEALLKKS